MPETARNNEAIPAVTNIDDFRRSIDDAKRAFEINYGKKLEYFYRGQDKDVKICASIYREMDYDGFTRRIQSEYNIYKEVLRRFPGDFPQDENVFNKLVRMQHYGIPTRLVDVTSSSLIALFFACGGYKNQTENCNKCKKCHECDNCMKCEFFNNSVLDGYVFVFGYPEDRIAFFDDYEKILTVGLETKVDFMQLLRDAIKGIINVLYDNDYVNDLECDGLRQEFINEINDFYEDIRHVGDVSTTKSPSEFVRAIEEIENKFVEFCKKYDNDDEYCNEIGEDRSYLERIEQNLNNYVSNFINEKCDEFGIKNIYSDQSLLNFFRKFKRTKLVRPHLNNDRIRKQKGAFIIHPPFIADFDELALFDAAMFRLPIRVDGESKEKILLELKDIGITRSDLFPELESCSIDIKNEYLSNRNNN